MSKPTIKQILPTASEEHDRRVRDEALVEAAKVKCSGCRHGEIPERRNNWYWHCNGRVLCGGSDIHELRLAALTGSNK